MGKNSPNLMFRHLSVFLLLFIAFSAHCQNRRMQYSNQSPSEKAAQSYVAGFNSGKAFTPPSEGLMSHGAPAPDAVAVLKKELRSGTPETRENIVLLLADLGLQSRTTPKGTEVIREKAIIETLVDAGLNPSDLGRSQAVIALRRYGMQPELAAHSAAIARALKEEPSDELLLLVAKAKATEANEPLQVLKFSDEWHSNENVLIALAALGDRSLEEKFIAAFREATTPEAVAEALRPLSLIGTERTLSLVAATLRTPLIIDRPNIEQKSVRIDVLEALRYNFPDEPALYPNNINTDADYAAAENFCIRRFKTDFNQPRPPFLTYFGYPR
jgi:hypothetical protein